MKLDDLYRDVILDHHKDPRGRNGISRVDGSAEGKNTTCGDEVKINLRMDGERIAEIQVNGSGCAISTAAGSMLAEIAVGKTATEASELATAMRSMLQTGDEPSENIGDLDALAGVSQFPVRVKCAMLPMSTLLKALAKFEA